MDLFSLHFAGSSQFESQPGKSDCKRDNWDDRMKAAISIIQKKRNDNGSWNMQAAHPGLVHFIMEKAGTQSRWNTLRAMRVIKHFEIEKLQPTKTIAH